MSGSWRRLFVHAVWGTWDRLPLVTPVIEPLIFEVIGAQAKRLSCDLVALGGVDEHVHALFRLHPSASVAAVVRAMKSASSKRANDEVRPASEFRWQGGYAALTVDRGSVEAVGVYVREQKARHARGELVDDWEIPREEDDGD